MQGVPAAPHRGQALVGRLVAERVQHDQRLPKPHRLQRHRPGRRPQRSAPGRRRPGRTGRPPPGRPPRPPPAAAGPAARAAAATTSAPSRTGPATVCGLSRAGTGTAPAPASTPRSSGHGRRAAAWSRQPSAGGPELPRGRAPAGGLLQDLLERGASGRADGKDVSVEVRGEQGHGAASAVGHGPLLRSRRQVAGDGGREWFVVSAAAGRDRRPRVLRCPRSALRTPGRPGCTPLWPCLSRTLSAAGPNGWRSGVGRLRG